MYFSPPELIYELGLARDGAAGPSSGAGARAEGLPLGSPAGETRVPPPDMSCNFRQTFEVPDICIRRGRLPAAPAAARRGGHGRRAGRPLLRRPNSFMFYSFPAPINEASDAGVAALLLRRQIVTHTCMFLFQGEFLVLAKGRD